MRTRKLTLTYVMEAMYAPACRAPGGGPDPELWTCDMSGLAKFVPRLFPAGIWGGVELVCDSDFLSEIDVVGMMGVRAAVQELRGVPGDDGVVISGEGVDQARAACEL